ncbi:NAD(P)-dependent oxidoreductase [Methylotenera sp.]|uniref:NAD-dependent epimerase/dehydratase family protein n=1 Tax=Methylotenera sp. TaxID=2051956 RepID=UPI00271D5D04|nr:NAD-dependent epimerase/dehydratase family protein [Methylotenera sp.]MDO9125232.1 NAD-dependent epimerase/dehydratase family protein [Parvibaculum sp.]MDP2230723.1 NAD-dependent epimerase/dehydratase family protein [Methylotenera sp.]
MYKKNINIAITGGSGFIGQRLVDGLEVAGFNYIRPLTRKKRISTTSRRYYVGDLSDKNVSLAGFLDDVEVIYHCAGEIKNTSLMRALHVDGTASLLKAVSKQIKVTQRPIHWVQLSSVGAYGSPEGSASERRIVTEATSCNPLGEYEVTKTMADELVIQFAEAEPLFSYTILRPSNVIGASMTNQSLRSLINMIKKRLFFYIGSRSAVATYIHVDDVVSALMLCGTDLRARGQVFNLSNDCALSEIVSAIAKASGFKAPNLCVPENLLRFIVKLTSWLVRIPLTQDRIDALVRHTHYPTTKIKEVLDFVPQHDIPSAVTFMFKDELNAK